MRIPVTEFKARCLRLMDEVARTREPIVVTKRGRPVAKLVPFDLDDRGPRYGYLAGTVTVIGDIVAPLEVEWEADRR